jgi:pseudouridine synthase
MKITYLKLENFVNIKAGMKKTKVEIDLSNSKNNLILLCGPNGTGKTSLLSELHPFANSGNMDVRGETNLIIEGKDGYKEVHIEDGEDRYVIKHHYLFSKKTKSVKSFVTKNGVELNDGKCKLAKLEITNTNTGIVTLTEGRYHQIKRMFGCYKAKVIELERIAIGNFNLPKDLKPGDYIEINELELNKILEK